MQNSTEKGRKGYKVLLIDADPQGSLSASLGIVEPDKLDITLTTIMENIINEEEVDLNMGLLHNEEGVDFIPANIELSALEIGLISAMRREYVLSRYIEKMREYYDYILIDCMPSLGMITMNVLTCADSVLIPCEAAYLPVKGLQQLIKTIGKIKRNLNPKLVILGIVITKVDNRTNYAKEISELLRTTYSSNIKIFNSMIPVNVKVAESSAEGKCVYAFAPKSKATKAYETFIHIFQSKPQKPRKPSQNRAFPGKKRRFITMIKVLFICHGKSRDR